jgi:hypothetical protein
VPTRQLQQLEPMASQSLYGSGALDGVINLVSRRPDERARRELSYWNLTSLQTIVPISACASNAIPKAFGSQQAWRAASAALVRVAIVAYD